MPAVHGESRAEDILSDMTLEEKIAQMLVPAFQTWGGSDLTELPGPVAAAIRDLGFGGVILFASNIRGTAQTAALLADMQEAALASKSGVPLLTCVDQEGGYIYRLSTGTEGCGNMALGAAGDPALARETGAIMGSELSALGFNVDFAPVMDLNNNPANPIIGVRSFSDSPELASAMGAALIEGLDGENVISALKHFPGHGDTGTDSHSGLPTISKSREALRSFELVPFAAGIEAGADIIMTAHIQYPQIEKQTYTSKSTGQKITLPATLSKTILTDILRGELGFEGLICTDALNMGAIADHFSRLDTARLAINAGVDLLLMPVTIANERGIADCKSYIDGIASLVCSGSIAESQIDSAVLRILSLKEKRGILDLTVNKEAQVKSALSVVGSAANHAAELKIAEQAITLVKNSGDILPLALTGWGKAALFFPSTDASNSAQYAVNGLKSSQIIPSGAQVEVCCYKNSSASSYQSLIRQSDTIVAAVSSNGAGSVRGGWQADFLDSLIDLAHKAGKKVAVISLQLPYDLARYQKADALLAAFCANGMSVVPAAYNGEAKTYGPNIPAAVRCVFGAFAPTGTLPVDIPKLGSGYAFTKTVLYPRGTGITGWTPGFHDVPKGSFFESAADWAARNKITEGVTPWFFGPPRGCTRAQTVTFLWRAAGSPEADVSPAFTDVPENVWYAPALRWAVSCGITDGFPDGTFKPNAVCTRGQIVTLLQRASGSVTENEEVGFTDVQKSDYFAPALGWAVSKGIASGFSDGTFRPANTCTRAQMVVFMERAYR